MSNNRKLFLLLIWLVGTGSLIAHSDSKGPIASSAEIGPAETYAKNCAECHGTDGRAKTPKGRRLAATDFTTKDWNADEARGIRIITKGKSDMPSFKDKLTADEIREVFGYVVAFRK